MRQVGCSSTNPSKEAGLSGGPWATKAWYLTKKFDTGHRALVYSKAQRSTGSAAQRLLKTDKLWRAGTQAWVARPPGTDFVSKP